MRLGAVDQDDGEAGGGDEKKWMVRELGRRDLQELSARFLLEA